MFDPFFLLPFVLATILFVGLLWAQTRLWGSSLSRQSSVALIATLWLLFVGGCAYISWPLLFLGAFDPGTTMYVQAPRGTAPGEFNQKLAELLQRDGFRPDSNSISSPEDPKNPMYILEARGVFTRIWAQTALLSPEEAAACGYRLSKDDLIANDERQYAISVTSIPFFSDHAHDTFATLRQQLLRSGYGVSPKQLPCMVTGGT